MVCIVDGHIRQLMQNEEMKMQIVESGYHFSFGYTMYKGKVNISIWMHSNLINAQGKVELNANVNSEFEGLNKCLDIICGIQTFGGYD